MRMQSLAHIAASLGIVTISIMPDEIQALSMIEPIPSTHGKLSVGDKAHRAYRKSKLYSRNGDRECARRVRQLWRIPPA